MQSGRTRIGDTGRHHLVGRTRPPAEPDTDEDTGFGETVFAAEPVDEHELSLADTIVVDPVVIAPPDRQQDYWPRAAERRTRAQAREAARRQAAHAPLPVDTIIHLIIVAAAWAIAIVVTLAIASETKIGPVLVRFTASHGLHEGDLDTALLMGGLATVVTVGVGIRHVFVRRRRRRAS